MWVLVLGLLAELASCADWHPLKMDAVHVARQEQVRHAGMVGENDLILVTGKPDSWQPRTIVHIDAAGNEHPLVLPTQDTACVGEALIVRDARWRYSRCSGNGVQFVSSETPDSSAFVVTNDPALFPTEWLPFEQDDPGGVLLSMENDERTMVARVVTPSGIQELGRFDRGSTLGGAERGQAVRLRADTVALITIETGSSDAVHSSIVLRVIRNGEIVTTSRLAFHASGWASIAAAIGTNQQLAVVATPFNQSAVLAILVDPEHPDHPSTRPLTTEAVAVPSPGLRLIANGDRFVAGWIRSRDGAVQIAEFDHRLVLPAVTVADHIARSGPAISLGHATGEDSRDVTIFWTEDGGNVMMRRLPDPPTGSLIASDLLRRFSDWAKGWSRSAQSSP